ncbi:MAG TPA: hypothetical protein VGN55_02580 [Xanthobacteraceae bacterium]
MQSLSGSSDWKALANAWPDGRIKLALTARLLALRREVPQVFTQGDYRPLRVQGPDSAEIVAFARCHGSDAILIVAARLFNRASQGGRRWPRDWNATVSVDGFSALQQLLAEQRTVKETDLPASELLGVLPIAILRARDTRHSK